MYDYFNFTYLRCLFLHYFSGCHDDSDCLDNQICDSVSHSCKIIECDPPVIEHSVLVNVSSEYLYGDKVSVRCIAKTFASGKTEKLVYQTLAELGSSIFEISRQKKRKNLFFSGLPCEKNDAMDPDTFTFEKFYALYKAICPRTDIDELFKSM